MDLLPKLFTVLGLGLDFIAVVIGGRAWIYRATQGLKAAFAWNSRNLIRKHEKGWAKKQLLEKKLEGRESLATAIRLYHHLAGMRILAWQVDSNNRKHRAQWDLPPRTLKTNDGYLDPANLSINAQELVSAISDQAAARTPKDFSSLSFKIFLTGTVFALIGVLLS